MMGVISWVILGLVAGILAKLIMPGKDGGGFVITVLLGIAGAFVGGWVGAFLGLGTTGGFSLGSIVTATLGALLLLIVYRQVKK